MAEGRATPVGIIVTVAFALPFIIVGLAAAYFGYQSHELLTVPLGLVFVGAGVAQIVRVLRRTRSAEARAAAIASHQSATLRDVLPPTNVDYRTATRTNFTALEIYGRVLGVAPLPPIRTRPGVSLPIALPIRDEASGIGTFVVGSIFFVGGLSMGIVAVFSSAGGGALMSGAFALVGALVLIFFFKKRMARLKLPHVELSTEPVFLGEPFRVHIIQVGPARITRLRVDLSCKERVTFTVGTDTRHEENEVFNQELLDDPGETLRAGERWPHDLHVTLPATCPASFKSKHNAIAWTLRVRAEILNWPDYDEHYELRALPKPVGLQ